MSNMTSVGFASSPDCIATDAKSGDIVNIEFEFRSSSFWSHRTEWRQLKAANPLAQWWVVSWHDDLTDNQKRELPDLTVVALRDRIRLYDQTHTEKTVLNWYDDKLDDPKKMIRQPD